MIVKQSKKIYIRRKYVFMAFACVLWLFIAFTASPTLLAKPLTQSSAPYLVKDIRINTLSGYPQNLTNISGTLYFTIDDGVHGYELWTSNGTEAGTRMIKDISDEKNGSFPAQFTEVNGVVFFSASDGISNGLWKTDGTEAGTVLVKNIVGGNFAPQELVNVNGTLYFKARDQIHGYELWKSDGTTDGTVLVKDIFPGLSQSNPRSLTNVDGVLYFVANDGVYGNELWKSDGTDNGTVLVKDIRIGTSQSGSDPVYLTVLNSQLYFLAYDGVNGHELWKTDGTEVGTAMVTEIRAGNHYGVSSPLVVVNDHLFFAFDDGINGVELWKSDGTVNGTEMVKDLAAGTFNGNPMFMTDVSGTLFFTTKLPTSSQAQLWKSDGTDNGTTVVHTASLGANYLVNLTAVNGLLYFWTSDAADELYKQSVTSLAGQLWKSDGTESGTLFVEDVWSGVYGSLGEEHVAVANQIFFEADDGMYGNELWRSSGMASTTGVVKDVVTVTDSAEPSYPVILHDALYFVANDGVRGVELWRSDGTDVGTILVKDIRTSNQFFPLSADPQHLTVFQDKLYFSARDDSHIRSLWQSDGTEAGTVLLRDSVIPNPANGGGLGFVVMDDRFYFAGGGPEGNELWKSDGTSVGTMIVKDISTIASSNPQYLTRVGNLVYFVANDNVHGEELWKSDGTDAGTVLVSDIRTGSNSSFPRYLTNVDGTLYFAANDGVNGTELWKSDGTESGTMMVKDLSPGGNSNLFNLMSSNGLLYFTAITYPNGTNTTGEEIWRSDGTESGTFLLQDIQPDSESSGAMPAFTIGDRFYFVAWGSTGVELWQSDGSIAGTVVIKTLATDPTPVFSIQDVTNLNGLTYFRFDTAYETTRDEIWQTDGTTNGTRRIYQTFEASSTSNTEFLIADPNQLYFGDDDGQHGLELWGLPATDTPIAPALAIARSGNDLLLTWSDDAANQGYELHRGTTPDFTPSGTTLLGTLSGSTATYTDVGALSTSTSQQFYRVRALADGQTADSNTVGAITYALNNSGGQYTMIGIPFVDDGLTTAAAVANTIGNVSQVLQWNPTAQTFRFFSPPNSGDNFAVAQGDALFVAVNAGGPTTFTVVGAVTPTTPSLTAGYNFITLPLNQADRDRASVYAANESNVNALFKWNSEAQTFQFFAPPASGDDFVLYPGVPMIVASD